MLYSRNIQLRKIVDGIIQQKEKISKKLSKTPMTQFYSKINYNICMNNFYMLKILEMAMNNPMMQKAKKWMLNNNKNLLKENEYVYGEFILKR